MEWIALRQWMGTAGVLFLYGIEWVEIKRNEHPFPVVRLYSVKNPFLN